MRKSPSLIPNGGSLDAVTTDVPDILPHVEEPPVTKDVTTAEVSVCDTYFNCVSGCLCVCIYTTYVGVHIL